MASPWYTLSPYTTLFRSIVTDAVSHLGYAATHQTQANALIVEALDFAQEKGIRRIWELLREIEGFNDQRIGLSRSDEHTSELQAHSDIVCRLLLEKKNIL